jgi:AraC family transcriptional activator of mtrCDE
VFKYESKKTNDYLLMDALGDILRIIRLQVSVYFNACFCSSWGLSMEQSHYSMFHIIVKGDAWLQMDSLKEPMHLRAGDIVFFPKGAAHTITCTCINS